MKKFLYILLLGFLIHAGTETAYADDSILDMPDLPGSSNLSQANTVSGNGLIVGGISASSTAFPEAVIWNPADGTMTPLGVFAGGGSSYVRALNYDGSVAVGYSDSASGNRAFRWTSGTGMVNLGVLSGYASSTATAVSSDGSVVVGGSINGADQQAFRWTQAGGMVGLGDLPGGAFASSARGVSGDGSIVVGVATSADGIEAFRWTQAGGMVGLGDLSGGAYQSQANAISKNGKMIVGAATSADGIEAMYWTQETGMVGLGDFPGSIYNSYANAVNADGTVIVGGGVPAVAAYRGFRWTAQDGMVLIEDLLTESGVDLTDWTIGPASGVNDVGDVIVGSGAKNGVSVGYIANVATGFVSTPQDFGKSLNTVAQASQAAAVNAMSYIPQGMFVARNINKIATPVYLSSAYPESSAPQDLARVRPAAGNVYKEKSGLSYFFLGGYGIGHNNDFDNDEWNGTAGLSLGIGGGFDIAVGVLGGTSGQELDFEGESDMDALGGMAAVSYAPGERGLRAYASAYAADLSLDIKRGYANGAGLDSSKGSTDGMSYGGALKIGWEEKITDGGTSVMPFVEGRYARTKIDGYTENGGSMPASYTDQDSDYVASRVGMDIKLPVDEKLELTLRPAWGHRYSDGGRFSANVAGLSQSLSADPGDKNWFEGTVGVSYDASENVNFTAEVTGRTGNTAEPAVGVIVGTTIKF